MAQKKTITIEAKDNTKVAFNGVKKNLKGMETSVDKTKRSMDGLKGAIKGALGALTVGAFVQATRSTLNYADALGKTSARLGVTTKNLQTLRFAATQSGMTTEALEMSMQRFTRRLAEAGRGTGVLKDTFKDLGMSIRNADGTLKSAETMLGEVADMMATIPDQGERVRLAFQMFDSEGVKMVNMLQNGSGALEDMQQKLIDTGAILNDDFIKASEDANDAIDLLQNQIKTAFGQAISGLAVPLKTTAQLLGEFIVLAKEHPTVTKMASAVVALGVATAMLGGKVTLVLSAISGLIALFPHLNQGLEEADEIARLSALSTEDLNKEYVRLQGELKKTIKFMEDYAPLGVEKEKSMKKQVAVQGALIEAIRLELKEREKIAKADEIVIDMAYDKFEAMKMTNKELKAYTDHMFKTQGAHQKLLNQMRQEKKVRYSQAEHALESVRAESAEKYRGIVQNTLNDLGYLMDKEAEQRRLYGEGMVMGQEAQDLRDKFHQETMDQIQAEIDLRNQASVSYTHLTLPTNREV